MQQPRTSNAARMPRTHLQPLIKPHIAMRVLLHQHSQQLCTNGGETCISYEVHVGRGPSYTWLCASTRFRRTRIQKESALFCKHWNKIYTATTGKAIFPLFLMAALGKTIFKPTSRAPQSVFAQRCSSSSKPLLLKTLPRNSLIKANGDIQSEKKLGQGDKLIMRQ